MEARYIFIYANGAFDGVVNLRELRVFGSPSLTKTASIFKSVPNDPSSPDLVAQNLV